MVSILPFFLGVSGLGLVGALRSASSKRKTHPPGVSSEGVLLEIRVPKGNEKDPLAAENMFASLHGLLRVEPTEQEHISFEIASDSTGIHFYVWCPSHLKDFISGQIYAQYPSAEVRLLERDYMQEDLAGLSTCGESLVLTKESFFPLRTFRDFEVDPMAAVTGAMSEIKEGERIWMQIIVRPVPDNWQGAGHQYAQEVKTGIKKVKLGLSELIRGTVEEVGEMIPHAVEQFTNPAAQAARIAKGSAPSKSDAPRLSPGQELELKMIEDKLTRVGFEVGIRVFTAALESKNCQDLLRGATASFRQFSVANLNSLDKAPLTGGIEGFKNAMASREFPAKPYVLDTAELASLFHLPNISVETPAIAWATYKKGEPPANIPTSDCTYFAQTTFRERLTKFGIKNHTDDRRKHMYLIGKTGTGKSTVFKNMIVQDIQNGEGVAVLDPHGDLVKDLLDFIPPERIKDVIYFDPSDVKYPIGLNLLELQDPSQKNLLASGLLDAFKKHFEFSWGPRLEYLLNNAILTLLDVPGTTLLGITRILSDKNYQKYITYKIKDPVIREFWDKEYVQMMGNPKLHSEAVAPIQNKVGRFLSSSTIRNIMGQRTSSLDLEDIMNSGKILLINLSKGQIGADNANLLGSLLISRINFAAMQRVRIPEAERRDFYLYADEFQNFASGSFASILSEARKYRLNLHLTHQYVEQLPEEMREAVFGNVGTMIVFTIGAPDAQLLEKEFLPYFTSEDLISLDRYHLYAKLSIDGMTSKPFSAISLPPPEGKLYHGQEAIEFSRSTYGRDAVEVEDKIKRWTERTFSLGMAIAEEKGEHLVEPSVTAENPPEPPQDDKIGS